MNIKKRANGDGYIYFKNGKAYCTMSGRNEEGALTKINFPGGKTRKEAERKIREFKSKNCISMDSLQTLGQWLKNWIENYSNDKADSTISAYRSLVKCILPKIGMVRLIDLKVKTFSKFNSLLGKEGRPAEYIKSVNILLSAALNQAVSDEVIYRNVMRYVKKPKSKKSVHRIFSEEEFKDFYKRIQHSRYHLQCLLMLYAGLRRGEAMGMRWSSINLKTNIITIKEQMKINQTPSGTRIEHGPLKTDSSYRDIKMPNKVMDEFRKIPASKRNGFVFKGKFKSPRCFSYYFKKIKTEMGIEKMRLHDLRHTHASHIQQSGAPLPMVSQRLGHSSTKVTGDIYSHSVPGSEDIAVTALEALAVRISSAEP